MRRQRKIQIAVIGSTADLTYSKAAEAFATQLGEELARQGVTLLFGAEKDANSLPTTAALAARRTGGVTIGVTYEKGLATYIPEAATAMIATGLVRGGGRETTLVLSCDAAIALAGGSGTLNEICVAYQANIPVIVIEKFGGWASQLASRTLDNRNRYVFQVANNPTQAVKMAIKAVN